jgi:hypothetical protein
MSSSASIPAFNQQLGGALSGFGGELRCMTCGRVSPLGDVGDRLTNGWPKCCGYTMRWVTARQMAKERA